MKRRTFVSTIVSALAFVTTCLKGNAMQAQPLSPNLRAIASIKRAAQVQEGSMTVRRPFAGTLTEYVSPWVMLDEVGPMQLSAAMAKQFILPAHPHAGVIPTTLYLEGDGHHRDSIGVDETIEEGAFMMFSSGKGALHMERAGPGLKRGSGSAHALQIWLNMPKANKYDKPHTAIYPKKDIPVIEGENHTIKVVIGTLFDKTSPVKTLTPTFYYHVKLNAGAQLTIPTNKKHNAFLYELKGAVKANMQFVDARQIALFERGRSDILVEAQSDAEFLILGGQPHNDPVVNYGPFVMTSDAEIRDCMMRYQRGDMGNPNKVNKRT